jgi:hypothetical protein
VSTKKGLTAFPNPLLRSEAMKPTFWTLTLDAILLIGAVVTIVGLWSKYRPFLDEPYFES